jgi:hypothetical protein
MEDSESILATISDLTSFDIKAHLIITNKRMVFLNHSTINPLGAFGAIGGLIAGMDEKARINYEKSHSLDEVIKLNKENKAFMYEDIKEVKLIKPKHWWNSATLEIKAMVMWKTIWGTKKKEITEKYSLSAEQHKQLSEILPKVDSLKEKFNM